MKPRMRFIPLFLLPLLSLSAQPASAAQQPQQDRQNRADQMPACCRMMTEEGHEKSAQGGGGQKMDMMQMMQNCPCMKMMMKGGMMNMPGMNGMHGMPGMSSRNGASGAMGAQGLSRKAGELTVRLQTTPSPPRAGNARFTATVTTASGAPVTNAQLTLGLSMPSMSMGGPTVPLRHQGRGVYVGSARLGMAGPWQADVSLRQSGRAPVRTQFAFNAR